MVGNLQMCPCKYVYIDRYLPEKTNRPVKLSRTYALFDDCNSMFVLRYTWRRHHIQAIARFADDLGPLLLSGMDKHLHPL